MEEASKHVTLNLDAIVYNIQISFSIYCNSCQDKSKNSSFFMLGQSLIFF